MKVIKIKPVATIVAQLPAGVEQDVIVNEGIIYVPMLNLGDAFTGGSPSSEKSPGESSKRKVEKPSTDTEKSSEELYTEDDLMDKETDELLAILKEMKVDPSKSEGKNTHKKLRLLILAKQGGSSEKKVADEEEEEEKPKGKGGKKKSVEIEDLEVDDRVNVYWENMDEWFEGTVIKVSKSGKVTVCYDSDNEEEILDPDIHTEINIIR